MHARLAHWPRHIQDFSSNSTTISYWGYADRVVPCTNDAGSCAYLDLVYWSHEVGMLYTGILWATILGILFLWAVFHYSGFHSAPLPPRDPSQAGHDAEASALPLGSASPYRLGGWQKLTRTLSACRTRYLLPDAPGRLFGRTTRLQVVVLLALVGYITVWSFVGMTYNKWVTPVKKLPGVYNTRTSLGPWSDRIGVLAFALTPLSIMLSSRESILSLLTGVPYQNFNFLHRWLGYVIFLQSALHTIGWCVIEARLYQPQPTVGDEWIRQKYMVWGVVAMILLFLLFILSTPWAIRRTGYEFFRKAHYVLAMVYIGACYGHWKKLECFLLPSLLFWFIDRGARIVRTALLHYHRLPEGGVGFRTVSAAISFFPDAEHGDVVRLELENDQDEWRIGQHFYLCFTEGSIWQSHPFTPLNNPLVRNGKVAHSYILRAKSGETRKITALAAQKLESRGGAAAAAMVTTPVILTGPYGEDHTSRLVPENNILCVCGGTGVSYCLPVLLELARQSASSNPHRKIELVWVMRYADNAAWVRQELDVLRRAQKALNLTIRLYHTRQSANSTHVAEADGEKGAAADETRSTAVRSVSSSSSLAVQTVGSSSDASQVERRPDLPRLVSEFVASTTGGPTVVFASGPGSMISDLRACVARCASGTKVWKGDERFDVRLVCDDRLEW